jgi:hypothetical protein
MTTLNTHGYAYLNVAFNGELHEAGVSYLYWPIFDNQSGPSVCIDVLEVNCDVHIPVQFVKSALKKYLKIC